jgi:hypothetical protein
VTRHRRTCAILLFHLLNMTKIAFVLYPSVRSSEALDLFEFLRNLSQRNNTLRTLYGLWIGLARSGAVKDTLPDELDPNF